MSQFRIDKWFQWLEPQKVNALKLYQEELCRWTKKINLISPASIADVDRVHLADGILGCKIFSDEIPSNSSVYDLGSGNGIPGFILAVLRPEVQVTCVDSDERKMSFIKNCAIKFGLKNLRTEISRVEALKEEATRLATARGFAELKKTLELASEKVRVGGFLYSFKGPEWENELKEAENPRWESTLLGEYVLPESPAGGARAILCSKRL